MPVTARRWLATATGPHIVHAPSFGPVIHRVSSSTAPGAFAGVVAFFAVVVDVLFDADELVVDAFVVVVAFVGVDAFFAVVVVFAAVVVFAGVLAIYCLPRESARWPRPRSAEDR
jgi:hypothetical protein